MLQTIKYSFLRLLRNKNEFFWILLFPIILGIFFKMGFSGLNESDKFSAIPVAIVNENTQNFSLFQKVADSLDKNSNESMLDITYTSNDKAQALLEQQKIVGILTVSDTVKLTISANMQNDTIKQSILSSFVKQYNTSQKAVSTIAEQHPEKLPDAIQIMNKDSSYNKKVSLTDRENSDTFTQYFYNLLAMACLFTATAGMRISIHNQGNLSLLGARRCISPMHKLKSIIGELIAYVLFNFACNFIAYTFIVLVLKIDLTAHLPLEILTLFIATLTGISLGFFIGSFGSASEHIKESICWIISMLFCFMSGLMVGNMKLIIETFCPILNRINPAVLISDSFYSLSVYNTYDRYTKNIITLTIMIIVFTLGGFLLTRRKKYASL